MKQVFKSAGWLGDKLAPMFAIFLLATPLAAVAQPSGTYISPPSVTTPPNVNATNFINSGVWNISTPSGLPIPYQTYSTYNYTNTGTMNCSIGWEFDHGPYPSGARGWSANFFNGNSGTISSLDGTVIFGLEGFTVNYLLISATNIVNQGTLSAGPSGQMTLQGSGVNLSRSGLEITPIVGQGSGIVSTNGVLLTGFYVPDVGIYDEYWLGGTNAYTFYGSPWTGTTVLQAAFYNDVGVPCSTAFASEAIGPLVPQAYDAYTNGLNPGILITTNSMGMPNPPITIYTNIVQQAVFAYASDTNIIPSVRFGPSLGVSNIFLPMAVQLVTYATNVVTASLQASTIYVADDLAAVGTNGILQENLVLNPGASCSYPTYRPDSVNVSRVDSTGYYTLGSSGNVSLPLSGTFFYDPLTFSNYTVIGRADAYSALVDNLSEQPPAGYSATNVPGKIAIYAKDLNLNKTRMTAAAEIRISASNLVSSAGANIDCQNLSYTLGSTNGSLNITNLAYQYVHRLSGTVNEWSGLWTNYQINVYTNFVPDTTSTNVPPPYIRSDITNVVEMDLAITVVDAGALASTLPVTVQNLILHSTNVVISDVMNVGTSLLIDGQSLTIQGGITLDETLQNWSAAIAPSLLYFTNNGDLEIAQNANFGSDGATNYSVFVNNGTINSGSQTINSAIYQNGGSQTVSSGFYLTTQSGKVENGAIASTQDVQFAAGTLKLNDATVTAGDQLYFYVTGSLFDAGGSSSNVLTCGNGFDLAVKPVTGDLLGTKLETTTPVFAAVDHYWSGVNLGTSPYGYTNNEAVGQLVLDEGTDSEFLFHATGVTNAIYVDLLDLSQCPDFLDPDVLTIDPNFFIYYAAIKLPASFTVPANTNGISQEPEEYMNGQFGGHLRWVSGFAGPNSSVDVLINGQTVKVNQALRYSKIIDSNGNGIPNYYDPNPFNVPPVVLSGLVVTNSPPPAKKFAISWPAAANTVYQVQYSTNLFPASWLPLQNYTNNTPNSVIVTVWDTNAISGQRYYRVSHP
jgi:hypothetical protein